ncbi:MAG: Fic family protein, partial [Oscillospiraceae bacterium]|nr:Fic family protein [Oscillospiraceae bacterium]
LFLTAFGASRPLDESLIQELHGCLVRNTYDERRWKSGERPGEYKKRDYRTGRNAVGALPEDVPEEMRKLLF